MAHADSSDGKHSGEAEDRADESAYKTVLSGGDMIEPVEWSNTPEGHVACAYTSALYEISIGTVAWTVELSQTDLEPSEQHDREDDHKTETAFAQLFLHNLFGCAITNLSLQSEE